MRRASGMACLPWRGRACTGRGWVGGRACSVRRTGRPRGRCPEPPQRVPSLCTNSRSPGATRSLTGRDSRNGLRRHGRGHVVRPGHARALHPVTPAAVRRLGRRARDVRPRVGCPGVGDDDRVGPRHLPGLLPLRRGARRPVAGVGHRVPARLAARRSPDALVAAGRQRLRGRGAAERPDGGGARHRDPRGQGRVRRAATHPGGGRQRRCRDRDHRRRGRLRGPLRT